MNDLIKLVQRGYKIEFSIEEDGLFCITMKMGDEIKWLIRSGYTNKEIKETVKDVLKGYRP